MSPRPRAEPGPSLEVELDAHRRLFARVWYLDGEPDKVLVATETLDRDGGSLLVLPFGALPAIRKVLKKLEGGEGRGYARGPIRSPHP